MVGSCSLLYWVNSDQKTLAWCSFDGSHVQSQSLAALSPSLGNNNIYGLAILGNYAYITQWVANSIIRYGLLDKSVLITAHPVGTSNLLASQSGTGNALFSAVFSNSSVQAPGTLDTFLPGLGVEYA